jgi:hypothetical protein
MSLPLRPRRAASPEAARSPLTAGIFPGCTRCRPYVSVKRKIKLSLKHFRSFHFCNIRGNNQGACAYLISSQRSLERTIKLPPSCGGDRRRPGPLRESRSGDRPIDFRPPLIRNDLAVGRACGRLVLQSGARADALPYCVLPRGRSYRPQAHLLYGLGVIARARHRPVPFFVQHVAKNSAVRFRGA